MRRSKVGSTLWEKKEQGKPLSFYLSPEITLATPTTVTHRPSFFLSLLRYRDYIGTRKRFLFIGTHFQRQRFLTFFSLWKNIEGSCPLFYLRFFRIYLFFIYIYFLLSFWGLLASQSLGRPSIGTTVYDRI
jgi:hypothetical protein